MELAQIVNDVADALTTIDREAEPHKQFKAGVGPYGEPQLLKAVANHLNESPIYCGIAKTKRTPDLLISGHWALEFKIARPFGDNGNEAENWSVNLLHPYEGNTSLIGDCLKLQALEGSERKAAVVIGYEHSPPRISLTPLLEAFELVASRVAMIRLGPRALVRRVGLRHPIHQQLLVAAWEVKSGNPGLSIERST